MPSPQFISEFNRTDVVSIAELLSRYVREACIADMQAAAEELSRGAFLPLLEKASEEGWEILTLADLLAHASQSGVSWLIPNVIAKKCIHIISCAPGGTKSWIMLEMARAFTGGSEFLHVIPVPLMRVLYIDEEMGKDKMGTRARKMAFEPEAPFFYMGLQQFKLDIPAQLHKLKKLIEKEKIDVVFIDTLTRVHNVRDENDNAAMRVIFQTLTELTSIGVTIILAHHDRKRGGDDTIAHERMRGAQEIGAMADMAFACEKIGEGAFRFIGTKTRLIPEEDKVNIEYFVKDNTDKTETSVYFVSTEERKVVQHEKKLTGLQSRILNVLAGGPMMTSEIADRVTGSRNLVLEELKKLVASGDVLCEKIAGRGGGNVYTLPPPVEEDSSSIIFSDS